MKYTRIEVFAGPDKNGAYSQLRYWMKEFADEMQAAAPGKACVLVKGGWREAGQCFLTRDIPQGDWPIIDLRFDKRSQL